MRVQWIILMCLLGCSAAQVSSPGPDSSVPADGSAGDGRGGGGDLAPLCGPQECQQGMLCQTAQGCCSCGPFARACLTGWTCAIPGANDQRCPQAAPTDLTACTLPDRVACWYCTGGAPLRAECVSAAGRSECQMAGLDRCWAIAGPTRGCD